MAALVLVAELCRRCGDGFVPELPGQTHCYDCAVHETFRDFRKFCKLLTIRVKDGPPKSFGYDGWFHEQQVFERHRTGRDIVLKPRQVGFTTLELARDLWHAIVNPGHQVLVIVHDAELAETLFQTLHVFCDSLRDLGLLPKTKYSSKREVVFAAPLNSAVRIVEAGATEASAAKKGRSGTIHRLHATEVAFWGAAQETIAAALSAVPTTGEVVIESTANGAGGWFYERVMAAKAGRGRFTLHFFPWYDHDEYRLAATDSADPEPGDEWEQKLVDKGCDAGRLAFWRTEVEEKGLDKALQEYPESVDTCFRAAGALWFDPGVIDKLTRRVRAPLRSAPIVWQGRRFADALIFADPAADRVYVVFGDVAEGVARDGSAACVMDARTTEVVATFWSNSIEPGDFGAVLAVLGWLYNGALVGWERNNHGHATARALRKEVGYTNLYVGKDNKFGWNTTPETRPLLWEDLAHAIRAGSAYSPDADVVAECRTIIRDEDGRPRARGKKKQSKDSSRDDRYVAWGGANQIRESALARRGSFHIPGL